MTDNSSIHCSHMGHSLAARVASPIPTTVLHSAPPLVSSYRTDITPVEVWKYLEPHCLEHRGRVH